MITLTKAPENELKITTARVNRSGPLSWKSRIGAILPITGFIAYVAWVDYRWFDPDNWYLLAFYTFMAFITLLIMCAGVFWRSFTHLPVAKGRVIAIVPVYNEDSELMRAAVWSLTQQTVLPDEIHVMDDGSRRPLDTFHHPLVTWHTQKNQGKRHAQANILRKFSPNAWDYIMTVDSDSVCDSDALEHLLRSMSNPKVQAATGMVFVRNWSKNFLTRLTDINVISSCLMFRMFRSWFGVVTPTSGALALYRANIVYDNLEDYVTSGTAGDDRRLSFYALLRGQVVGVHEAVVETALPDKWSACFRQRMRWSKSAWLGIPFVLTNLKLFPTILYMYPVVFALMWPFVVSLLVYLAWTDGNPVLFYGAMFWVVVAISMTGIYSLYRPDMSVKDRFGQWLLSPVYPILGLFILRPACYWALTKLRSNSWHTRESDLDDFSDLDSLLTEVAPDK